MCFATVGWEKVSWLLCLQMAVNLPPAGSPFHALQYHVSKEKGTLLSLITYMAMGLHSRNVARQTPMYVR